MFINEADISLYTWLR